MTLMSYAVSVTFLGVSLSRFLTLWKAETTIQRFSAASHQLNPFLVFRAVGDILFLTRLLKVNDLLWIGEWLFHGSLVLVALRHLRYVLTPVPDWIWFIQPFGIVAGYVLPLSLIFILIMKAREGREYLPSFNFFLLLLLLAIAVTGLLIQTIFRTDVVAVKEFMSGIFTFNPTILPCSLLFILHFFLFLVLVVSLPTHIFTAPFVMIEARRHEKALETLVRGK